MDIGTSSALAQKLWRRGLTHQAEWQTFAFEFASEDEDSPFVIMNDAARDRGDTIRYKFSPTVDTQDPFLDGATRTGNEQQLEIVQSELSIGFLSHAFRQDGHMAQQRTNVDLKKAALTKLSTLMSRLFEQSIFNHLCGFTPANYKANEGAENGVSGGTNYTRTGMNAVVQLDTSHIYTHTGETVLEDQNLDSGDVLTFAVIDDAIEHATSKRHQTYPMIPGSDGMFDLFISPRQFTTLKSSSTAGQWMDLTRAILEGGAGYANSAFNGYFAGTYSRCRIHVTDYVTRGVSSAAAYTQVDAVDRAVLVGANALRIAFGEGFADGDHLDWVEQVSDYNKWGVAAETVWGCDRVRYNLPSSSSKVTYGAYVIPSYEG